MKSVANAALNGRRDDGRLFIMSFEHSEDKIRANMRDGAKRALLSRRCCNYHQFVAHGKCQTQHHHNNIIHRESNGS